MNRVKIEIALKGTIDAPDLRLSSDPPASKEWLLLMLATNKSWDGAKEALTDTKSGIPIDLARDFMDYFLFSGSGSKILGRAGMPDVSLKYNEKSKSVGIKKDLSDKANLNYSVDLPQSKEDKSGAVQKIGAGYSITENVSLEGERDLKKEKASENEVKTEANDKVTIKYKKKF